MFDCFSKENLQKAFEFYDLSDEKIKAGVFSACEKLNADDDFAKEIYNIRKEIFNEKETEWKKIKGTYNIIIYGEKHFDYLAALLLLSGFDIHKDNLKKNNYEEDQAILSKNSLRFSITGDLIGKGLNDITSTYFWWGYKFTNAKIIRVGRLQYEKMESSDGKKYVHLHIPRDKKLDIDEVDDSLIKSVKMVEKYFGYKNVPYECASWLLSPQLKNCLDENSNIMKFQERFEIVPGGKGVNSLFAFVFNMDPTEDFEKLPEDTSLRKKLKNMLINGEEFYEGRGIIKQKYLKIK